LRRPAQWRRRVTKLSLVQARMEEEVMVEPVAGQLALARDVPDEWALVLMAGAGAQWSEW
jgi:hypothetical protein